MRLSSTLFWYFVRQYLFWLACVFATLIAIAAMFDIVELLRRTSSKEQVTIAVVLQLSLLKLPHLVQDMLPFAVLLGGMMAFWRMTRANELVVCRSAGISAWQFLLPVAAATFMLGAVFVTVFNPFAAAMRSQYEILEGRYLNQDRSELAVAESGIWLRQGRLDEQAVIHSRSIDQSGGETRLIDVVVLMIEGTDQFKTRIDAESALLGNGVWELENAHVSRPQENTQFHERYELSTDLTLEKIEHSFASADTLSFWELPKFIGTMEDAGFSANAHRLYLHSLMATPILLCAMVIVAACFSIRGSRRSSTGLMILGGVSAGFLLYLFTNVVHAMGLSTSIPAQFAAWMPAGVSLMLGLSALLHLEDG